MIFVQKEQSNLYSLQISKLAWFLVQNKGLILNSPNLQDLFCVTEGPHTISQIFKVSWVLVIRGIILVSSNLQTFMILFVDENSPSLQSLKSSNFHDFLHNRKGRVLKSKVCPSLVSGFVPFWDLSTAMWASLGFCEYLCAQSLKSVVWQSSPGYC
jgi:hypothetical protein